MFQKFGVAGLILIVLQLLITVSSSQSPEFIQRDANDFTAAFHKVSVNNAEKTHNNSVCSALSAWLAMSMAYNGARGNTEKQMQNGLCLTDPNKLLSDRVIIIGAQKTLIEEITMDKTSQLKIANKIYLDETIPFKSDFKRSTSFNFRTVPDNVVFRDPAPASQIINNWIDRETNSTIKKIIDPSDITSDTKVIIVNAIQFKGAWVNTFDAELTNQEPFTLENGKVKNVSTMKRTFFCGKGSLDAVSADYIVLPMRDDLFEFVLDYDYERGTNMVIILPRKLSSISHVEENLHKISFNRILKNESIQEYFMNVHIPKFKIESVNNIVEPMKKLGMTDMFTSAANFSGIADIPLAVDKIVQKVSIEVDESGVSATGATALLMNARGFAYETFRVNRPFLAYITRRNVILFSARIVDPSRE